MTILVGWLKLYIRSVGDRKGPFSVGWLSALLGIGMTIFGRMAEPNDRLPTYPLRGIEPVVVRVFDPGDDGVLGASNLDERVLQSVAGEKLCWG